MRKKLILLQRSSTLPEITQKKPFTDTLPGYIEFLAHFTPGLRLRGSRIRQKRRRTSLRSGS